MIPEKLPSSHEDPFIEFLHTTIRVTVKAMAVLMTLVIIWGTVDLAIDIGKKLVSPPFALLSMSEILETFAGFLTVLIAIEIFSNITLYIRDDVLPIKMVVATALMAIARKVIVFDFKDEKVSPLYIIGTAAVVLALGITYWLVAKKEKAYVVGRQAGEADSEE